MIVIIIISHLFWKACVDRGYYNLGEGNTRDTNLFSWATTGRMVVCKLIDLTVQLDHVFSLCSFFSCFKHKYEEKVKKSEFLKKIEFKNQNYVRQKTKIILNKT